MTPHLLRHRGAHAFPRDVEVRWDELGAVVGVAGKNGAGKTTVLDLIASGLYAAFPYRSGALQNHFAAKGYVRLAWSTQAGRYLSAVQVDPSRSPDAYLYEYLDDEAWRKCLAGDLDDVTGRKCLAGPKVSDFRRTVEELVGSLDWFLAGPYAVQGGSRGFMSVSRADRRAVLSEVLGLERYARLHEAASLMFSGTSTLLSEARSDAARLSARADRVGELLAASEKLAGAVEAANASLADSVVESGAAVNAAAEARMAGGGARDAARRLAKIDSDLSARRDALESLSSRLDGVDAALAGIPDLKVRAEEADRLVSDLAGVERALSDLLRARSAWIEENAVADRVRSNLKSARESLSVMERQVSVMRRVPCRGEEEYAGCEFLSDAVAAAGKMDAARERVQVLEAAATKASERPCPVDAAEVEKLTTDRDALAKRLRGFSGARANLSAAEALEAERAGLAAKMDAERAAEALLLGERVGVAALAAAVPALDAAAQKADELVTTVGRRIAAAQRTLRDAESASTLALADLRAAQSDSEMLALVRASIPGKEVEVADWTLLTAALSPVGIPALLVDRAAPAISVLATELLRGCWGDSSVAVDLVTQRENKDASALLETLEVVVTRDGKPTRLEDFSGGERALVAESCAVAVAVLGASGKTKCRTLLRDEVSAPLDAERAPAYARMLRNALRVGDFDRVVFVSHSDACLANADSVLRVGDGAVTAEPV